MKGSLSMPVDNDSAFLLDPHKRGLQNLDRMARYDDDDVVDLVVVGAGAGGSVLAQRLARRGWKVVVLEKGPFWDPDRDWVSDEKGAGAGRSLLDRQPRHRRRRPDRARQEQLRDGSRRLDDALRRLHAPAAPVGLRGANARRRRASTGRSPTGT